MNYDSHRHPARSGYTVTFLPSRNGGKQQLCIFIEDEHRTGVVQTFKLNASNDLADLESLIVSVKEAA